MGEKKVVKINLTTIFLVVAVIIIGVMSFFLYRNSTDKKNANSKIGELENTVTELNSRIEKFKLNIQGDERTDVEKQRKEAEDEQIIQTANNVYKSAYEAIDEGSGLIDYSQMYSKIDPATGKTIDCYKVNLEKLNNLLSDKLITNLKNKLFTDDQKNYYTHGNELDFFISTIFGNTDQGIRPLTLVTRTENTAIFTGQLAKTENRDADKYPLYLIFTQVNGNWVIDLYE